MLSGEGGEALEVGLMIGWRWQSELSGRLAGRGYEPVGTRGRVDVEHPCRSRSADPLGLRHAGGLVNALTGIQDARLIREIEVDLAL